jgi:cell division protein FtsI/penicillin-binding protein 2
MGILYNIFVERIGGKMRIKILSITILIGIIIGGLGLYHYKSDSTKTVNLQDKTAINPKLQEFCEKELKNAIALNNAKGGMIVIANPKNGEILTYAAKTSTNDFNEEIPKNALTKNFETGSLFKVINIAAAIELNKINEKTLIEDTGKIKVGPFEYKNYDYVKNPSPGRINLPKLLKYSSNVGSIKIAQTINNNEYQDILKQFNINKTINTDLGIDVKSEVPKFVNDNKKAAISVGYSLKMTPLHIISLFSAIANDGEQITPHFYKQTSIEKVRIMNKTTSNKVKTIMSESTIDSIKNKNSNVIAKTATVLNPKSKDLQVSGIAFLPINNPKLLIYIMIDSPKGEGLWGSQIIPPILESLLKESKTIVE